MYKHILVPLDGSELAERALVEAKHLALEGSQITLFQVIRLPLAVVSPDIGMNMPVVDMEDMYGEAKTYLEHLAAQLVQEGFTADVAFIDADHVADAIVSYATKHQVDLIIKTTHGRGGLSRLVFGSVAEGVLRHARCPILLIRTASAPA